MAAKGHETGQKEGAQSFTGDTILHHAEKTARQTGLLLEQYCPSLRWNSFLLYQDQHHKLKRHPNLVDLSVCPISNNLHQFKYSCRVLQKAEKNNHFCSKTTTSQWSITVQNQNEHVCGTSPNDLYYTLKGKRPNNSIRNRLILKFSFKLLKIL